MVVYLIGISGWLWVEVVSDTNRLMSHNEISRLNKVNKSLFPLNCEVNKGKLFLSTLFSDIREYPYYNYH